MNYVLIALCAASILAGGSALAEEKASVEKVSYTIDVTVGDVTTLKHIPLEGGANKDLPTKIIRFESVFNGAHAFNVQWECRPTVKSVRITDGEKPEEIFKELYPNASTSRYILKKELQPNTEYSCVISAPKKLGHIVPFSLKFTTAPKAEIKPE